MIILITVFGVLVLIFFIGSIWDFLTIDSRMNQKKLSPEQKLGKWLNKSLPAITDGDKSWCEEGERKEYFGIYMAYATDQIDIEELEERLHKRIFKLEDPPVITQQKIKDFQIVTDVIVSEGETEITHDSFMPNTSYGPPSSEIKCARCNVNTHIYHGYIENANGGQYIKDASWFKCPCCNTIFYGDHSYENIFPELTPDLELTELTKRDLKELHKNGWPVPFETEWIS